MPQAPPALPAVRATWYDGRVSQPRAVLLHLSKSSDGPRLAVHPIENNPAPLEFGARDVGWPERWSGSRAPGRVLVDLRDRGSLEVTDVAAWQAAADAAGVGGSLAERMQTRWRVLIGVALLALAGLVAFFQWGTPWAATLLTRQVPLAWETALAQQGLRDLDESLLKPSKLPASRQDALRVRFDALAAGIDPAMRRYPAYAPAFALSFRSGFPANAFALPGGAIVMTDALVEKAAQQGLADDALIGVLAHEIGHVVHRHTTRLMVEQAVLNVGLGLALGDASQLLSIGGSLLTGLAYRRTHEAEADCFAAALMRKEAIPTGPMADLLLGLEGERSAGRESRPAWADLLSSHPQTAERAQKLKSGQLDGC